MDLVSVIIPYCKKKNFIKDAVLSILNQTYKYFEIIIIYDDSDLEDLSYIKEISNLDSRIYLIVNEKKIGAGLSRNLGIKSSKGTYLAFLDSDDIWKKEKLNNKYIGFNRRFYKTTQRLRERLLKKDLIYADIRITENYNDIVRKYGKKIKNKIHLVTFTTHMIDLALFLFGKIQIKNLKIIKNKRNKYSSVFANCIDNKKINTSYDFVILNNGLGIGMFLEY